MTIGKKLVALGLVIAAVTIAARLYFPSDRRQILRQLDGLSRAASVGGVEAPVVRLANAMRVANYFTEDAVIRMEEASSTIGGRAALATLVAQARAVSG